MKHTLGCLCFFVLLAGACSDSGGGTNAPVDTDTSARAEVAGDDAAVPDAAPAQDVLEEVFFDLTPDTGAPDVTGPSCQPGEGCFLDKCTQNSDCQSQWCVEHLGEGVCTSGCQDECPPGWSCQQVAGTVPDLVYVCVSAHANLCRPCNSSADCKSTGGAEDVCVDYGAEGNFCGGWCGPSSEGQTECPWGFTCKEVTTTDGIDTWQCVADAGVCPCTQRSAELLLWTSCERANEWGSCSGKRLCAEDGLSDCDADTPAQEVCDGLDNDCDGEVDEPDQVGGDYVNLCDDENPCTQDICDGEAGCAHEVKDTGECLDGDACTIGDHCEAGACVGSPIACDDENPCTDDVCDGLGGCTFEPNTDACDDGDPCTVADQCKEGACVGFAVACDCQTDADCTALDDGDVCNGTLFCNQDEIPFQCAVEPGSVVSCPAPQGPGALCLAPACDPQTGACSVVPANDGIACNDGNACTVGENCSEGTCEGGGTVNCADNNPCTEDFCDPSSGCVHTNNASPCNDGNACTTGDVCTDGSCVGSGAKSCDDNNPCTDDSCDPQTGCVHSAHDGACDDGNECTADDQCVAGICKSAGLVDCDDGNVCTKDTCLAAVGCLHQAAAGACDDGDSCTLNDACSNGECVPGKLLACDDGNSCTKDSCQEGACVHTAMPLACDDGDACTLDDTCVAGLCTGQETLVCDDDNPCTIDSCNPESGCVYKLHDGACDDGDVCTTGDHCHLGECIAAGALTCDDKNGCTMDTCSPQSGCVFTPAAGPCDDSNACTTGDACVDGVCKAAGTLACDDDNECTLDACDPATGCIHTPKEGSCSDGNACTLGDVCVGGECQPGEGELACGDGNPCTDDTCDPATGCAHTPNDAPCNDANACTTGDMCGAGFCQPGQALACDDDGDACTQESCDPAQGCLHTPIVPCCGNNDVEAGEECDDGNQANDDGCDAQCQNEAECEDVGNDKLIYVAELNACLQTLGAQFFNVQYIEVAYGHTDYLDNICQAMGYTAYNTTHGGDKCNTSANMYPSHCGQGWLGPACGNGCGNTNYDGFYCL